MTEPCLVCEGWGAHCDEHKPSGEARPTPVEPEAPDPVWDDIYGDEGTARLAVEPDGLPLDVERLAEAMTNVRPYGGNPSAWARVAAGQIAAEYARLAGAPSEEDQP